MTKYAHPAASSVDHLHGDEDETAYTPEQQARILRRADEIIGEWMADRARFRDLVEGLPLDAYVDELQRLWSNARTACSGKRYALDALCTAASRVQSTVTDEAYRIWSAEAIEQAEREILGGGE